MDCCDKPRLCSVGAKCSDLCSVSMTDGAEYDGYVPSDMGLGTNEDFVQFTYCLNCGRIQGVWPLPATKLEAGELVDPDDAETCSACDGTGECVACCGDGEDAEGNTCESCDGSGVCGECDGSGEVPT